MTVKESPLLTHSDALLLWLQSPSSEGDDPTFVRSRLRPSNRLEMAHRIATKMPHAPREQWTDYLIAAEKAEPHKFLKGVHSPDVRAAQIKTLSAAGRLEFINREGAKQ